MQTAQTLLFAGEIYLWLGIVVAVLFLGWGLDRIDRKGHGAWMFRPLLVPGVMLIWPLVLWRWLSLEKKRDDPQNHHRPPLGLQRTIGLTLALAIPVFVVASLLIRQNGPLERPAVMLQPVGETPINE